MQSDWFIQFESLRNAVIRLPIAALLSAILAFRPRRRGTPERQSTVVQTQILLAIVGAVVMLVVGASLARAFGIVGAAGLVRYRAKIADPKDAGVMLSTLAIGLACGVGLYFLAAFAMLFVLGTVWLLESFEPDPYSTFELTVTVKDKDKDSKDLKPGIEHVLSRYRIPVRASDDLTRRHRLRGESPIAPPYRYGVGRHCQARSETDDRSEVGQEEGQARDQEGQGLRG